MQHSALDVKLGFDYRVGRAVFDLRNLRNLWFPGCW